MILIKTMANVTDPVIRSLQGTDPQNLMEYITRQKIYDGRFWKEECFGLSAADVIEKAATSLSCVGGTYGGAGRPTKFLALTLKLLQLQPSIDIIQTFLEQDDFKYLKALGCFYLRLTGRPQEIYQMIDPLYANHSKLRYRDVNEWKLIHMDEFIDDILTKHSCCGIAMPRLPLRSTLQEAGYLEDGQRPTALESTFTKAGGIKNYLKIKVEQEEEKESPQKETDPTVACACKGAVALWGKYYGERKDHKRKRGTDTDTDTGTNKINDNDNDNDTLRNTVQPNTLDEVVDHNEKKKKKKKKDKKKYGSLFKSNRLESESTKNSDPAYHKYLNNDEILSNDPESIESCNKLREKLGLKPLK